MRIVFKRPGFLFFRRFFFVKSVSEVVKDGKSYLLAKNKFGQILIPIEGSVIKILGKGWEKIKL